MIKKIEIKNIKGKGDAGQLTGGKPNP